MTLPRIIALYDAAGNMFCIIVYLLVCIHPSWANDLYTLRERVFSFEICKISVSLPYCNILEDTPQNTNA